MKLPLIVTTDRQQFFDYFLYTVATDMILNYEKWCIYADSSTMTRYLDSSDAALFGEYVNIIKIYKQRINKKINSASDTETSSMHLFVQVRFVMPGLTCYRVFRFPCNGIAQAIMRAT